MKSLHYIIKSMGKYDEQPALKAVKLCKQYLELWHQIIPVQNRSGSIIGIYPKRDGLCRYCIAGDEMSGKYQAGSNNDSAGLDFVIG